MPRRTKYQNTLYLGEWNSTCERCGMKFKACDLREDWKGLQVCYDCWEPRHPSESFRMPKEDVSVPFSVKEPSEATAYWLWGDSVVILWGDSTEIQLNE